MTDEERTLRDLLTRSAPSFSRLDGQTIRDLAAMSAARPPRRWQRAGLVLAAATIVVVSAITATLIAANRDSLTHSGGSGPSAAFRIALVLSATRAPADGTPLHGYALVINQTGHPIEIRDGRCDEWLQAGLSGPHVRLRVISLDVACASTELREGTTRISVTIFTTYDRCLQGNQHGTPDSPHCRGPNDDQVPALPPGTYHAEIGTQHTSTTPMLPKPIVVILQPVS